MGETAACLLVGLVIREPATEQGHTSTGLTSVEHRIVDESFKTHVMLLTVCYVYVEKLHAMVLTDYDWLRALEKMVIISAPAAQGCGATLRSVGSNYLTKSKH